MTQLEYFAKLVVRVELIGKMSSFYMKKVSRELKLSWKKSTKGDKHEEIFG